MTPFLCILKQLHSVACLTRVISVHNKKKTWCHIVIFQYWNVRRAHLTSKNYPSFSKSNNASAYSGASLGFLDSGYLNCKVFKKPSGMILCQFIQDRAKLIVREYCILLVWICKEMDDFNKFSENSIGRILKLRIKHAI